MDSSLIKVNETIEKLRLENEYLKERKEQLSSQVKRCLQELMKKDNKEVKITKEKRENEIAKEVYFKTVREINKALDKGNTCHAIDLGNLLRQIIVDMGEI